MTVREEITPRAETGDGPEAFSIEVNEEGQTGEEAPLRVESWPIKRVIAFANNPRKRTAAAVDKLPASIKEFGWKQPIAVDGEA